ncbi:MAG: hypothetical protein ACOCUR_00815 [Nanoarchaeota archaeon]
MKKQSGITSINFGDPTNPARVARDIWVRKNGKNELSRYVRKIFLMSVYDDPIYSDFKIKLKLAERKAIGDQLKELALRRDAIEQDIKDLGGNLEDIYR